MLSLLYFHFGNRYKVKIFVKKAAIQLMFYYIIAYKITNLLSISSLLLSKRNFKFSPPHNFLF